MNGCEQIIPTRVEFGTYRETAEDFARFPFAAMAGVEGVSDVFTVGGYFEVASVCPSVDLKPYPDTAGFQGLRSSRRHKSHQRRLVWPFPLSRVRGRLAVREAVGKK